MLDTSLIAPTVQILSTLLLGIIAIWKDDIVAILSPLKVDAEIVHPAGMEEEGGASYTYHLRIVNKTPARPIINCRVQLVGFARRHPGAQTFEPVFFPVPRQFIWAPAEDTPKTVTFSHWWYLDFGTLKGTGFFASLYEQGGRFDPNLTTVGAIRWSVLISGDNLSVPVEKTFEISWNGECGLRDSHDRAKALQIREVREQSTWIP